MADDTPEVVEALDIARALYEKGDRVEAARFVRRASDAAHKASRLIALARAADEIESGSMPPPALSETRLSRPQVAPPARSNPPPLPTSRPKPPPVPVSARPAPEANRVRVCVRMSVRDPGLLVVRQLAAGEPLPAGTREAYLVMVENADALPAAGAR
jgi:hypothetical protein